MKVVVLVAAGGLRAEPAPGAEGPAGPFAWKEQRGRMAVAPGKGYWLDGRNCRALAEPGPVIQQLVAGTTARTNPDSTGARYARESLPHLARRSFELRKRHSSCTWVKG